MMTSSHLLVLFLVALHSCQGCHGPDRLVVAVFGLKPYADWNPEEGWTGADIELVKVVTEKLGIKEVELVRVTDAFKLITEVNDITL